MAVIGAIALVFAAYFYVADLFGLKTLTKPEASNQTSAAPEPITINGTEYNLSPSQKYFLEKAGIDPASLPSTISPELENCLVETVGEERANQIKGGDVPTITDLLKAKTCLNN